MKPIKLAFLALAVLVFIYSGVDPKDRFTWVLEVAPAIIGLPLLVWLDRKRGVTTLLFVLVCLHAVILCIGGKYTYAEVPAGFWVRDALGLARNHYDRLGHFFQGFEPAILAREVLLRKNVLPRGSWLSLFCFCICLAFSASYEFIEWWTALLTGEAAEAFLGTQGDPWDTQWDMFMAAVGAVAALLFFSRLHDRELAKAGRA